MLDPSLGFSRRGAEAQWKKMAGDRSQESAESFAPRLRSRIDCLSLIRPAGRTPSGLSLRSSLCRSAPFSFPISAFCFCSVHFHCGGIQLSPSESTKSPHNDNIRVFH